MTKPSYEELERKIGLCEVTIEEQLKERSAVYAELARVRGLLQRTSENMEAMCLAIARNDGVMCAETVNMAAKLAISLRLGAESADIGKVNRVDGEKV